MFWDSIISGFSVLGTWQFWAASLSFIAIFIFLFVILGFGIAKTMENGKTAPIGCLAGMILPILLQVVSITLLVVFLLPILMGGDELTPLTYFNEEWWKILKAGFIGFIILMLIGFIPVIGDLATQIPGVSVFVIGMIIFHALIGSTLQGILEINNIEKDLTPGFWTIIGFIIFAAIIVLILTTLIGISLMTLGIIDEEILENGALLIGPAIGVVPGLIALAIYISYVMLMVKQEL
jgi:cytochrome b561